MATQQGTFLNVCSTSGLLPAVRIAALAQADPCSSLENEAREEKQFGKTRGSIYRQRLFDGLLDLHPLASNGLVQLPLKS